MRTVLDGLEADGRQGMLAEGADVRTLTVELRVDARYRGQSFELGVAAENWIARFHEAHAERYGYQRLETPVEAVTLRAIVSAPPVAVEGPALEAASGPVATPRYARAALGDGARLAGPAIVEDDWSTVVLPPGAGLGVDGHGHLHIEVGEVGEPE
ncbi:MAG: hypothetical protein IH924_08655 [Proteobacteria bacterium]|nr:hypothetical protein [Pseudomonadota bacterium]